ncbi:hypothetical protein SAMN05428989_0418 [Pseudoxanthomonas sp. GM95]|uniref:hypothetical protein n=1 Tax=Pseudoxanthomonas sp. GM95 TaxID=1881043 RepID=UPI0008AC5F18|nr:hypothetical protein [Pseudoxanthomonas sp. GM95]SEK59850.1 hypothetical protein SAMN05428989_0418 [Pseudoxanthomonas sp. GM95]
MNTPSDFDHDLRQLHAASLGAVSPQTLARLRSARHAAVTRPRRGRTFAWLGATACTALLAMVAATQLMPTQTPMAPARSQPATVAAMQASSDADNFVSTADVLDQNPDLYVWLGSDASPTTE